MISIAHRGTVASSVPSGGSFHDEVLADSPDLFVRFDSTSPTDLSGNGHTITPYGSATVTTDPTFGVVRDTGAWWTTAILGQTAWTLEGVAELAPETGATGLIGSWRSDIGAMITTLGGVGRWGPLIRDDYRHDYAAAIGWHHYAATWDGAQVVTLLDGQIVDTQAYTTAPGLANLSARPPGRLDGSIGLCTYQGDAGTFRWPGNTHSTIAYSHALSPARLAAHATAIGLAA